ncbi:MAG: NAD(P)-binding domain-containing protein [Proteobacteria bacterium]|nr:NAD(P)-binding domain-containing protein [Pseudomonadota bacterium]
MVIGAGHTGLAISHGLSERSIEHVVLERGEVANSWRHERWDSLTLLTPNWQSRLPGYAYSGDDPDGFMAMPDVIGFIDAYAALCEAPVQTQTTVTSLRYHSGAYTVATDNGDWHSRSVVVASGACNLPSVPKVRDSVPKEFDTVTPHDYRNPGQLRDGKVLVVGASATGLQLADEIHRSGRSVTIAVGEHVRMPRTYRGRDIQWWMHTAGVLDEGLDDVDDINRARNLPSPQLVGSHDKQILDLNAMTGAGMKLVGRLMGFQDGIAQFSGSLKNVCALADLKMRRLLETIDEWATASPDAATFEPPERFERTRVDAAPCLVLDLRDEGFETVLFATGYRPDYSWLDIPVLDRKGMIRHDEGVVTVPGLYVIGLPFLRRRKSSFIHGTEDDARYITGHLESFLSIHA